MLPSAHRKPERRDSKAFKMETQFNTGRAWFLSVALLLGTLGFVLVDHSSRTAPARPFAREARARRTNCDAQLEERFITPSAAGRRRRRRTCREPQAILRKCA